MRSSTSTRWCDRQGARWPGAPAPHTMWSMSSSSYERADGAVLVRVERGRVIRSLECCAAAVAHLLCLKRSTSRGMDRQQLRFSLLQKTNTAIAGFKRDQHDGTQRAAFDEFKKGIGVHATRGPASTIVCGAQPMCASVCARCSCVLGCSGVCEGRPCSRGRWSGLPQVRGFCHLWCVRRIIRISSLSLIV